MSGSVSSQISGSISGPAKISSGPGRPQYGSSGTAAAIARARSTSSPRLSCVQSFDDAIACFWPTRTRKPRSLPSARSSFSWRPSRCATDSETPLARRASAASAPPALAIPMRSSSRFRASSVSDRAVCGGCFGMALGVRLRACGAAGQSRRTETYIAIPLPRGQRRVFDFRFGAASYFQMGLPSPGRPSSGHIAETLSITLSSMRILWPHSRFVSGGHLSVASSPIFEPSPDSGAAKSR